MNIKRKAKIVRTKIVGRTTNFGFFSRRQYKKEVRDQDDIKLIGSVVGTTTRIMLENNDGEWVEVYLDKLRTEALQAFLNSAIGEITEREEANAELYGI